MSAFPTTCAFIILFSFPGHAQAGKKCRLATRKRPAYEPASDPPRRKRPPVSPDEAEAEPDEEEAEGEPDDHEEEDAISISLNDEEERYNLVSPLLTSKFTVSVLNVAWHSFPNPKVIVIKTSVSTYYLWLDCTFVTSYTYPYYDHW